MHFLNPRFSQAARGLLHAQVQHRAVYLGAAVAVSLAAMRWQTKRRHMEQTTALPLNDKRIINAWAFFDWANSSYALTISVAIFPAYYASVTDEWVLVLGKSIPNTALYAYAISGAYLLLVLASPILSGIADYSGRKMAFLRFFTTVGALSCVSLFFFQGMEQLALGTIAFMLATIGFAGGLVFYNAYLPEIVTEDLYDRVSAKGFAYGYIGSVILLLLNLLVILHPSWFGIHDSTLAVRLAFVMVGLWWLGFALIPFSRLPKGDTSKPMDRLLWRGFEELRKVWRVVRHERNIKRFLLSFFCYSAGVQTILFLASIFAEKELHFGTSELIGIILILQIVAIGGAWLFARVSEWKGNKSALLSMLVIWTGICFMAYYVQDKGQFYVLAGGVGMVMGGIQSLSRSTYSKLIPEGTHDTASFFSFYDILEKLAIVLGTFSFGFIEQLTGGMRNSVLTLGVFFVASLAVLLFVRIEHARTEVEA